MRNLVKRYVAAMIRDAKTEEGLTEENFKVTSPSRPRPVAAPGAECAGAGRAHDQVRASPRARAPKAPLSYVL